jgi:hypothetical protein
MPWKAMIVDISPVTMSCAPGEIVSFSVSVQTTLGTNAITAKVKAENMSSDKAIMLDPSGTPSPSVFSDPKPLSPPNDESFDVYFQLQPKSPGLVVNVKINFSVVDVSGVQISKIEPKIVTIPREQG